MYDESKFKNDYLRPDEPSVYYACYGSNLMGDCFMDYMSAGRKGDDRMDEDKFESYRVELPHNLYFASIGEPSGAAAFLDVDSPGLALGRIWRISRAQFTTLALLECRADHQELPWEQILGNPSTVLDLPGCYNRIVNLGTVDGTPVLTVTSPKSEYDHKRAGKIESPRYDYTEILMIGALETSRLSSKDIQPFL